MVHRPTSAVLAAKGFFPVEWLATFGTFDSPLGHHPDRTLVPGVEISSGSLGHGLPIAVGVSLALDAGEESEPRVFVLLGDGELDEGSNHEAMALAGRLGLERLTTVLIDNRFVLVRVAGRPRQALRNGGLGRLRGRRP